CYEDAWRFLIREEEGELVHGSVQTIGKRINHAWVELPSLVWEPKSGESVRKDYFHEIAEPQEQARYTTVEAAIMAARTGNLGPWSDEERRQFLKRSGNPGFTAKKAISKEEAIGMLERLSATPQEAARLLVSDEEERRAIWRGIQERVKKEQNKFAPFDPREGPPLPRIFAGLKWPWKK
ncbi:unnamed protein product, partial [marine sediment metagenome]